MSASYGNRAKSCRSKIAHATKAEAVLAAKAAASRGGRRLVTYRCRWCEKWHNGRDKRVRKSA